MLKNYGSLMIVLTWENLIAILLRGIGAIGLDIYPFTLLKSLFEEARVKEEMGEIEKDFSLRLKLINIYYRKIRGERPKIGEYFYEYNNADVSMGIGFFSSIFEFFD